MAIPDHAIELKNRAAALVQGGASSMKKLSGGDRSDIFKINPYSIDVEDGFNLRDLDTPEALEELYELARQIKEDGVRRALEIRRSKSPGRVIVVDGHRRLRATKIAIEELGAQIETIPVVSEPAGQGEAERVAAQFVLNSGIPLNILAKGEGVRRLMKWGWDKDKIERSTGLNHGQQSRALEALENPEEVKSLIKDGTVSADFASKTMRKAKSEKDGIATIKEAVKTAQDLGKTRATAKHIAGGFADGRRAFRAIHIDLKRSDRVTTSSDFVVVKYTVAEWAAITSGDDAT